MSYQSDPIRIWHKRLITLIIVGAVFLVPVYIWALRPLTNQIDPASLQTQLNAPSPQAENTNPTQPIIDPQVFALNLWPPPTHIEETIQPKPKRKVQITLQLIGIIKESDGLYSAALYDPKTDRMHIVTSGEQINNLTVSHISANAIEFDDGQDTHTLYLTPTPPHDNQDILKLRTSKRGTS